MNKTLHKIYIFSFFLVGFASLFLLIYSGYDYYFTPLKDRFYHDGHKLLKPSGFIGHGLGIVGSFMMIFGVAIYMIRKRTKLLGRIGLLKHWLEFHIFLCTVGPMFVLFHTAFKFGGIVSVSFWSMVAVVLSGVIGRFIYVQIPRTIQGKELSMDELNEMDKSLTTSLREKYKVDERIIAELNGYSFLWDSAKGIWDSVKLVMKSYFTNKSVLHKVKGSLQGQNVDHSVIHTILTTIKNKLVLQRKIKLLKHMQNIFRYWHVAHLPFAIIMFVIMIIHIGVAVTFGYRWIF